MNQNGKYALIAGGVVVALYALNQGGAEVGSGISTGAEFAGAGLGIALIGGTILFVVLHTA